MNLNQFSYFDSAQPFLNLFKTAGGGGAFNSIGPGAYWPWTTLVTNSGTDTDEEKYLFPYLDSDGYATTLTVPGIPGGQQFDHLRTILQRSMPLSTDIPGLGNPYPSGPLRFKFIGQGSVKFGLDATGLSNATGGGVISSQGGGTNNVITNSSASTYVTCQVSVTPSQNGIEIDVTSVSSLTDYPRDFSLVDNQYASLYDNGQIYHPTFIAGMSGSGASIIRFMQPLATDSQVMGNASLNIFNFTANPQSGNTTATLAVAWDAPTQTSTITLQNGQDIQATFTAGSTAVTFGTSVSSNCTNKYFYYQILGPGGWSNRPVSSNSSWAMAKGAPIEVCLQLCNALNMHAWINVPPPFNQSDVTSLAQLINSTLNPNLICYLEWGNENWNSAAGFDGNGYATDKSTALFGSTDRASYYGRATSLMADWVASAVGSVFDTRFIVVMGGQAVNTAPLTQALAATSWVSQGATAPYLRTSSSGKKTIKAAAIATYFGFGPPAADYTFLSGRPDGGYTDFFLTFTQNPVDGHTFTTDGTTALPSDGQFGLLASNIKSTQSSLSPYGPLPLVAYEGGWGFNGGATALVTFVTLAARDSRMIALYKQHLAQCWALDVIPGQYNFCQTSVNEGTYQGEQWGIIESAAQALSPLSSAPARYQGLVAYTHVQ